MIHKRYSAITDNPWWLAGGIPQSACVAAYQAKGASSLAGSYINLANPGVYNAAPGIAPAWDVINGWNFATDKYLTCGITPEINWSMIIRFSGIGENLDYTLAGCYTGKTSAFLLQPKTGSNRKYYNGGVLIIDFGSVTSGVMAIANRAAYLNGVKESSPISTGTIPSAIFIGALNYNSGTPLQNVNYMQAFAIYKTTITDDQVALLTNAMNAL